MTGAEWVKGRRFSVLGLARSGHAAAKALAERGADVVASDLRAREDIPPLPAGVEVVSGENHVREGDTVIISPGIRPDSPVFAMAHEKGAEVWSDVELFWRLSPAPMLAVTGTDGKSTTTMLLGKMIEASGQPVFIGGNIGIPLCSGLDELTPHHVVVAEISCFQLVHCPTLRPRVAVFTNIAVDHVDYHGSFEAYQGAKRSLADQMGDGDTIVWNVDDREIGAWSWPEAPARWTFSRREAQNPGLFVRDGELCVVVPNEDPFVLTRTADIRVPGPHNLENAMAAAGAALAFGVSVAAIRDTLHSYPGLEHRIEFVREVDGVAFYNDSKATNPHAALAGMTAFGDAPMVVIAGGSEKGSDFSEVGELLHGGARGVVLIGETARRIGEAISDGGPPVEYAADLDAAVASAHRLAKGEGVVTLCPVCASFDMFQDFEHRGREFKAAVERFAEAP